MNVETRGRERWRPEVFPRTKRPAQLLARTPPAGEPTLTSSAFPAQLPKPQMNFFVRCGEVKLRLLLQVIVLIMLNNFFQNVSLGLTGDLSW